MPNRRTTGVTKTLTYGSCISLHTLYSWKAVDPLLCCEDSGGVGQKPRRSLSSFVRIFIVLCYLFFAVQSLLSIQEPSNSSLISFWLPVSISDNICWGLSFFSNSNKHFTRCCPFIVFLPHICLVFNLLRGLEVLIYHPIVSLFAR